MRLIPIAAAIACSVVAFAPAQSANDRAARKAEAIAAAKPAGAPVDCVSLSQISETRVRNDQIIDFYMRGGKVYRNTLPNSCPQLGFEESFSYKTSPSQLCSSDIITVLQHMGGLRQGASCGLGTFQPVTGVPK
jgi:hypothetical protein